MATLFISGTGTGIGKTCLSLSLGLWAHQKGLRVLYFKPIQCGSYDVGGLPGGDCEWIGYVSGGQIQTSNLYRFEDPVSPHLAAERVGANIHSEEILDQLKKLESECDFLIVEGAGGVAVPMDRLGTDLSTWMAASNSTVLLAAAPGLGTLNHTLLTYKYLQKSKVAVAGFAFCQVDSTPSDLVESNSEFLSTATHMKFWGKLPYIAGLSSGTPLSAADRAKLVESIGAEAVAWWEKVNQKHHA